MRSTKSCRTSFTPSLLAGKNIRLIIKSDRQGEQNHYDDPYLINQPTFGNRPNNVTENDNAHRRAAPPGTPDDIKDVCIYRNMRYQFSTSKIVEDRVTV